MSFNPNDPLYPVFLKLIKKHNKPHTINKDGVVGHSLCIGNPGHCKTSGNRREVEIRLELGHKNFLLYDAGRMDMLFFLFPSESDFWKIPKIERGKIIGKRSYPTEGLIPITRDIPNYIPNHFVPFTIPVCDLDENDIVAMVGGEARDMVKGLFSYMQKHVNEETTPEDYVNIMGSALKNVRDTDGVKPSHFAVKKLKYEVFQPLLQQGLISSKKVSTALDLERHIRDKKTISVLVLRHCPQNLWGFIIHFFMNHLFKLLAGIASTKRIRQKTTIVLNEVADLLAKDSETGGSSYAISKMIGRIAKQSRTSDMFMLLDTQIPQELPDVKDTMQRIYVYNSGLPEVTKAMEIMGISTRTGQITQDDMSIIPRLPPGWYYLFDRDKGVSMHKLEWTRSRTYNSGEDFYEVYDKYFGKSSYVDIRPILKEIQAEKDKSSSTWELREELLKGPQKEAEESVETDDEIVDEQVFEEESIVDAPIFPEEKPSDVPQAQPAQPEPPVKPEKKKIDWSQAKKILATV